VGRPGNKAAAFLGGSKKKSSRELGDASVLILSDQGNREMDSPLPF